jgi:hypothetical protein
MPANVYVILDTNALPLRSDLSGLFWESLARVSEARGFALAVPEIVIHESVNLRRVVASKLLSALIESHKSLDKVVHLEPIYVPDLDGLASDWRDQLQEYFSVLPPHGDDAIEALRREAHRHLPAREGAGGRDSLIWLTIVRLLSTGAEIYFISDNSKDFGTGSTLHAELRAEIPDSIDRLHYFSNPNAYLESIAEEVRIVEWDAGEALSALRSHLMAAVLDSEMLSKREDVDSDDVIRGTYVLDAVKIIKQYNVDGLGVRRLVGNFSIAAQNGTPDLFQSEFRAWVLFDLEHGDYMDVNIDLQKSAIRGRSELTAG